MKYSIVAVLLTLAVSGCGPTTEDQAPDSMATGTPGVTDEEVVFGNQTDLSGALAVQGAGSIDGARMRFDEVNDAGGIHGRQVKLIVEDTESKVPGAVGAVAKLISEDHVFAMFLSMGTRTDEAVLPEEIKSDVPNFYPANGARAMVEPRSALKFTGRPTWYDEMRAATVYFVSTQGKSAPCIDYDDGDLGREVVAGVQDQLQALGVALKESVMNPAGQGDLGDAITKLVAAKCDVVFLGTGEATAVAFLNAAHGARFAADFVGTDTIYTETFPALENGAGDGLYVLAPMARLYKADDMSPKVRKWWEDYVEKYGDEPRLAAMEGYRAADLVVRALDAAGDNPTRESFIKATEDIKDYTGPFGYHLSFGPDKHKGTDQSVLSMVDHGHWKIVARSLAPGQ